MFQKLVVSLSFMFCLSGFSEGTTEHATRAGGEVDKPKAAEQIGNSNREIRHAKRTLKNAIEACFISEEFGEGAPGGAGTAKGCGEGSASSGSGGSTSKGSKCGKFSLEKCLIDAAQNAMIILKRFPAYICATEKKPGPNPLQVEKIKQRIKEIEQKIKDKERKLTIETDPDRKIRIKGEIADLHSELKMLNLELLGLDALFYGGADGRKKMSSTSDGHGDSEGEQ